MARPDKAGAVAELKERFENSNAAILTEYRGLTVTELKELRRSLGENAHYAVSKNTLTSIAAKEAGIDGIDDKLTGPTAIAFVTGDTVDSAKSLRDFAKAHPALVLKGGYLDGNVLNASDITKLADLESREVLLAKTAGVLKASLSNAVRLFAEPLAQTARAADALQAKRAEGGEVAAAAASSDSAEETTEG